MEKRTYKVHSLFDGTPIVKLTGKWLKDKGFNVGEQLQLIEGKNMIILTKKLK